MVSLNSTSYSLHWRPNAAPERSCQDPLGYVFCPLLFKKFWSSLFWKIINLPGQSINNLRHCSQMCHRPDGQLTTTERWTPTQKKPKHWHQILENISSAKSSSPREVGSCCCCSVLSAPSDNGGCCCSIAPAPTSSKADNVFPRRAYIQIKHTHPIHTYVYTWLDTQILDRHSEHSYLILLLDLAKQGKGSLIEMYLWIQGGSPQQLSLEIQSAQ